MSSGLLRVAQIPRAHTQIAALYGDISASLNNSPTFNELETESPSIFSRTGISGTREPLQDRLSRIFRFFYNAIFIFRRPDCYTHKRIFRPSRFHIVYPHLNCTFELTIFASLSSPANLFFFPIAACLISVVLHSIS